MQISYYREDVLATVGEYDLVPDLEHPTDRIFIVLRRNGEMFDYVEEGLDNALIAAQRQSNFDDLLGLIKFKKICVS